MQKEHEPSMPCTTTHALTTKPPAHRCTNKYGVLNNNFTNHDAIDRQRCYLPTGYDLSRSYRKNEFKKYEASFVLISMQLRQHERMKLELRVLHNFKFSRLARILIYL